jgi:hypothetical protein
VNFINMAVDVGVDVQSQQLGRAASNTHAGQQQHMKAASLNFTGQFILQDKLGCAAPYLHSSSILCGHLDCIR